MITIEVQTVELQGGGTALRAVATGSNTSRGRVVALVDQAELGSTSSVVTVLRALATKIDRHGYAPGELL